MTYVKLKPLYVDEIELYTLQPQILDASSTLVRTHVENAMNEINCAIALQNNIEDEEYIETDNCNSSMKIRLYFLLDQLKYEITNKHHRRYNILTQVFALKVYGLSPASYRLIQSPNCLILPHERNILKIKNSIGLENEYLNVLRETSTTFDEIDRHVIIQMDEVPIKSDVSYKGGKLSYL